MLLVGNAEGWGREGHAIVCKIAQVPRFLSLSSVYAVFQRSI